MKQLRSPRRLLKIWHRRQKATIDCVAGRIDDPKGASGTMRSAFTASGLAVEEQVRKACSPSPDGLPIF